MRAYFLVSACLISAAPGSRVRTLSGKEQDNAQSNVASSDTQSAGKVGPGPLKPLAVILLASSPTALYAIDRSKPSAAVAVQEESLWSNLGTLASLVAGHAKVDDSAKVGPDVTLGYGSKVKAGARIGAGADLGMFCTVEGDVGPGASLGSFSVVEKGAKVGAYASIGRGVTVKAGGIVKARSTVDAYTQVALAGSPGLAGLAGKALGGVGAALGHTRSALRLREAEVEDGATVATGVKLGYGSKIKAGASIGTGAKIGPFCTVEGEVGAGATLGRLSVVEKGASVGAGASLGFGVRVKKGATVKAYSKVGSHKQVSAPKA